MKRVESNVDDRLTLNCIHCGEPLQLKQTNKDHIPSKILLKKPLPANVHVIEICMECNNSFSDDEEYFGVFLQVVISGSVDYSFTNTPAIRRALDNNALLYRSIKQSRVEHKTSGAKTKVLWRPIWPRIQKVLIKNARGHAYYELGQAVFGPPAKVYATPLQVLTTDKRNSFEKPQGNHDGLWPEVGSRMMERLIFGSDLIDANWILVQDQVYRYHVAQYESSIVVKSVLNEYLATEVTWDF